MILAILVLSIIVIFIGIFLSNNPNLWDLSVCLSHIGCLALVAIFWWEGLKAMASDATKENEELKQEIQSLKKKYQGDTEYLHSCCNAQLENLKALANRCWVLTRGTMCCFCRLDAFKCPHSMNFDDKLHEAKKLRRENKND